MQNSVHHISDPLGMMRRARLRLPPSLGGSSVNWAATKGTIWCDGKAALKAALEQKIATAIGAPFEAPAGASGLDPLILDQLTSGGQTIIEKLEKARSEVNFAVVLATPDDEGHRRDHPEEK